MDPRVGQPIASMRRQWPWRPRPIADGDSALRIEVTRRFATLSGEQRRTKEARPLIDQVVSFYRVAGGIPLAKALVSRSAIRIAGHDYAPAATDLEEALPVLRGGRYRFSAVLNLAHCRIELQSSPAALHHAQDLLLEAARMAAPGTLAEAQCNWTRGNLDRRLGHFNRAGALFELAHQWYEGNGDGFDRALLMLDQVALCFDRGDPEAASARAVASFAILQALRSEPDAYKAMRSLYRAAAADSLDRLAVRDARRRLRAAR